MRVTPLEGVKDWAASAVPVLPTAVLARIEAHLRAHFDDAMVARISTALQRGVAVRVETASQVRLVAYRRGILYVADEAYVIVND